MLLAREFVTYISKQLVKRLSAGVIETSSPDLVAEKIAIVIGTFSFGYIEEFTGSMKNSLVFLILFFAIGFVWLYTALNRQQQETNF